MAYNEQVADRIRHSLDARRVRFTEKNMFGGICFFVDDKMLIGVEKQRIMARIDPDDASPLKRKGVKPMDFTGRVMRGFVFVDDTALDMDNELDYWIDRTLDYNPKAKASKKKSSKNVSNKIKLPMNSQIDPTDPMSPAPMMPEATPAPAKKPARRKAARKAAPKKAAAPAAAAPKKAAKKAAKKSAKKAAKKAAPKKAAKKAAKKSAKKAAKKAARPRKAARKAAKKTARKAARKAAPRKAAKKAARKAAPRKAAKKAARKAAPRKAAKKAGRRR